MTQEALKLALEALAVRFSEGWHEGIKIDASDIMLLSEAAQALAQEQEPVAWRTFDGEGQYEYRAYEENETYAEDWDKRNPNQKGWVEPLYTPPQRTEQEPNWAWICNECGAQQFTLALCKADLDYLACSGCGSNEFHK
jgi:hypothetical protein